jgi:hypothetical protein
MSGTPGHSGGANRKTADEHRWDATYRPDRAGGYAAPSVATPVSAADRRRTLHGLPAEARRLALRLLTGFTGWDAAGLVTLRSYALAVDRLRQLEADAAADFREVRAETRRVLALLKMLNLG